MIDLSFRVYGLPRPGGSKKAFYIKKLGRSVVVDSSKHIKTWKGEVKDAALKVAPETPYDEPLRVSVTFLMPRPKAHFRTGKHEGELKPETPKYHTKMPDALKLMRGTEDALTGIIWKDDSRIYREIIEKVYTEDRPGAVIRVLGEATEIGL